MPNIKRVDFNLSKGSHQSKTFIITDTVNGVEQPYNMTDHIVRMVVTEVDDTPFDELVGSAANGSVTFVFDDTFTANIDTYKFKIEEQIEVGEGYGLLTYGDIDVIVYSINSLDSMIEQEIPSLAIAESYKENKVRYWQLFLQNSPTPVIPGEDVFDYTKWPELFNYLIAKLVNYDYLSSIIKLALISGVSSENSSESGGMVKKMETGPTSVEFYDLGSSISELFKPNAQGLTAMDKLTGDICELASRLAIHLNMCPRRNSTIIIPHKVGRAPNPDAITILTKNFP